MTDELAGMLDKISDLVHKLAGPMAEEAGMMLGDKVRVYRVKNWINTVRKTERLLREAGLSANALPPRLFLPLMEACSVEDNETLQDMWAGLLASASQDTDAVAPSFVETLKQLTPDEARYLQRLHDGALEQKRQRHRDDDGWKKVLEGHPELLELDKTVSGFPIPQTAFPPVRRKSEISPGTYERLGLIEKRYDLNDKGVLVFHYVFTEYASKFLRACQGPKASSASNATTPKLDSLR